jgi:hypothetical protein
VCILKQKWIIGLLVAFIVACAIFFGYEMWLTYLSTKKSPGSSNSHSHHHNHSDTGLAIAFNATTNADGSTLLTLNLQHKEAKWKNAQLKFELWQKGETERHFVDAQSDGNGLYKAKINLDAGHWFCIVHINSAGYYDYHQDEFHVQ